MQLICVIMGAPTRDTRNQIAKELFDYGFATYAKKTFPAATLDPIAVTKSLQTTCPVQYGEISFTLEKSQIPNIKTVVEVQESLAAPIALGQKVGSVKYLLGDEVLGEVDIVASQSVDAVRFSTLFLQMLRRFFLHKTNF
jgi:D-alanyl-D-alanine carboxypeptidase (penicillin-binding protein 5/6)